MSPPPPSHELCLVIDINWITVTQVSRSHSPVSDLTVKHADEVYLQNLVESRTLLPYLWYLANSILVDGNL